MITGNPTALNHWLHFHDGCTCHGAPELHIALRDALAAGYVGRMLERTDTRAGDPKPIRCYSMIVGAFEHHAKYGRYVMELAVVARPLKGNK